MDGDDYTTPVMCENFQPHEDLCPEPDSGPWYCNTDGFTEFKPCDGCELLVHPDKLVTCTTVESDGNRDSYELCEDCRTDRKKGTP
jgi:hypothetical protein